MRIIRTVKTFRDFLFYLDELPQNLLGLFVIFVSKAWYSVAWKDCYFSKRFKKAVTLGNYIILNENYYNCSVKIKEMREFQKLSKRTGWFYLFVLLMIKVKERRIK